MLAIHMRRLRYGIAVTAAAVLLVPGAAGATRDDAFGHRAPVHHEHEPVAAAGYNDTPASAEPVRLGAGRDRRQAHILGTLAPAPSTPDTDFYAIELRVGDVLGAAVAGAPELLAVHDPAGGRAMSSRGNLASLYPAASPLPRECPASRCCTTWPSVTAATPWP